MKKARTVLDIVFLIVIVFNLASWIFLPDNVATHFGRGGQPDGWMSKGTHVIIFTGLMILIYLSFVFSPKILDVVPARYISMPNREYWLTDENRPEAVRRMAVLMFGFGTVTGILMLAVSILTVAANLSETVRLNEGISYLLFLLYLGYTVWWVVRLLIAFRVPEDS
jgi:uncharacterized membrane protein